MHAETLTLASDLTPGAERLIKDIATGITGHNGAQIIAISGIRLGDEVTARHRGQQIHARVISFIIKPGEPARARLLIQNGPPHPGARICLPVSKLGRI